MTHAERRPTIPGRELRRLRDQLNLTRDEFALALGFEGTETTNRQTIRRFENGEREIPLKVARLAWMYVQHGVPAQWPSGLEAQLDEPAAATQ